MQYIPPLIFASLGLVDPAITAILSWLIGVESLPTLLTWCGGVVVMAGVGVISIGDHFRTQAEGGHHDENVNGDGSSSAGGATHSASTGSLKAKTNAGGKHKKGSTQGDTRYRIVGTEEEEDYQGDDDCEAAGRAADSDVEDVGLGDIELGKVHSRRPVTTSAATAAVVNTVHSGRSSAVDEHDGWEKVGATAAATEEEEEDVFQLSEKDERMLRALHKFNLHNSDSD